MRRPGARRGARNPRSTPRRSPQCAESNTPKLKLLPSCPPRPRRRMPRRIPPRRWTSRTSRRTMRWLRLGRRRCPRLGPWAASSRRSIRGPSRATTIQRLNRRPPPLSRPLSRRSPCRWDRPIRPPAAASPRRTSSARAGRTPPPRSSPRARGRRQRRLRRIWKASALPRRWLTWCSATATSSSPRRTYRGRVWWSTACRFVSHTTSSTATGLS